MCRVAYQKCCPTSGLCSQINTWPMVRLVANGFNQTCRKVFARVTNEIFFTTTDKRQCIK